MITTNIIHRVFQVRHRESSRLGTGFTIDVDDLQYLVTAQHVLKDIEQEDTILIFHEKRWKPLKTFTAWSSSDMDSIVLSPEVQLSPPYTLEPTSAGIMLGQTVYFCGYPYGLQAGGAEMNRGFPFPMVKHGIMAAITSEESSTRMVIDGHANHGMSGGPVVFASQGQTDYKVAAVIQGYIPQQESRKNDDPAAKIRPSGLSLAHTIDDAVKHLRANPSGVAIAQ